MPGFLHGPRYHHVKDESVSYLDSAHSLVAKIRGKDYSIYSLDDVVDNLDKSDLQGYLKGMIGERLLSVVLQDMIDTSSLGVGTGRVIMENERHKGKGFVVSFNDKYLLKFNSRTGFVLLEKDNAHPEHWYDEEKRGLHACQIDGLGYLHFNGDKHLLIGEAKTSEVFISLFESSFCEALKEKVVDPMQTLFPEHHLHYVYAGPKDSLFNSGVPNRKAQAAQDKLKECNVDLVLASLPKTPLPIDDYVSELVEIAPIAKHFKR